MIHLDGSQGEGGGQILRTALSLSLVTGRTFRLENIRAGRAKPGLMRQHLACVEAAARIGSATMEGAALGSTRLTFVPGPLVSGNHEFRIGSAGSTQLLLQTVLPPLLHANQPAEIVLEGGTHNPFAPPFPFMQHAFLPLLRRIGYRVEAQLERPGFYPGGGGRCRVQIRPADALVPLVLDTRETTADPGRDPGLRGLVCLAGLPCSIAEREIAVLRQHLALPADACRIEAPADAPGPGNTVHVLVPADGFAQVFTGFGARAVRAERVAEQAVEAAKAFLASGATVEDHLADQLLLPLALARGGTFLTGEPTSHTRTHLAVIREFLSNSLSLEPAGAGLWRVTIEPTLKSI